MIPAIKKIVAYFERLVGDCGRRRCKKSTADDVSSSSSSSRSSSSDSWSDKSFHSVDRESDTDDKGDAEPKEEQENPKHYAKGKS